jgi:hypothetical protein
MPDRHPDGLRAVRLPLRCLEDVLSSAHRVRLRLAVPWD